MRDRALTRSSAFLPLVVLLAVFALAAPAHGAIGPRWDIASLSATSVTPGSTMNYNLQIGNAGDQDLDAATQPFMLTGTLPPGFAFSGFETPNEGNGLLGTQLTWACGESSGTTVKCKVTAKGLRHFGFGVVVEENIAMIRIKALVAAGVPSGSVRTATFQIAGGGASPAATADPTLISAAPPTFGVDAFDTLTADSVGEPFEQAGAHPYDYTTDVDLNTVNDPRPNFGDLHPVQPARDVHVELPAGLIGNPAAASACTLADLVGNSGQNSAPLCDPASQVGVVFLHFNSQRFFSGWNLGPVSLFNMQPPPGVAARFGFSVYNVPVTLSARVNSRDYSISVDATGISEGVGFAGSTVTIWGDPADPSHDPLRSCPGESEPAFSGKSCPGANEELAFIRNPTSCQPPPGSPSPDGLTTSIAVDSWPDPGAWAGPAPDLSDPAWKRASVVSHHLPGYPSSPLDPKTPWGAPYLPAGCGQVPFDPSFSATPTTEAADSPSGLEVDLEMPQQGLEDPDAISESDLRDARVTLPEGMSINPSAANGRQACTLAQIGLHSDSPAQCPEESKVGKLELQTPLLPLRKEDGKVLTDPDGKPLPRSLEGSVYLAAQQDNPFGSLLAIYMVVEDEESGLNLKLAGHVIANESSGQLETVFADNPQTPFSHLHLELYGGPSAPLRTPSTCGTYTTNATLTPWSGNAPVDVSSSFAITQGCGGGFSPKLAAGTQNPLAGTTSPFSLRITRDDATQELGGLSLTLPPGLSGYLKGIPYCPDATLAAVSGELGTGRSQETSPSCPAASQVGTVTVGAGAGTNPFYTSSGRAYLAGPYKGAPLSLAVIAPAVAGPFDLGSVVVRNALRIDPVSAQITAVSDPLPQILHGIPLDLRDVRVELNRDHFTLNPTSCEPMSIGSSISSTTGATASPAVHFQVAACDRLGFRPKLSLKLKGGTRRSGHPALTAVLRMPQWCGRSDRKTPCGPSANIARVQVALPHSEFLAQSHIRTICTRVQFAAGSGGGAQCPPGSIYGKVTASTPILDQPLTGNVYLRSSANPLPDMVLALHGPAGQPIQIEAVGRIDSHDGGIRTTFASLPDAPLTKVVLRLPGGTKSLLENSRNLCATTNKATVQMDGHNGKTYDFAAPLQAQCPKAKGGKHPRR